MPIQEANGIRINYMQLDGGGGENREDLVMVHGLGTSLAFWYSPHGVAFSEKYRVTLFDLRGHGRSSMPAGGYQPPLLARDLQAMLDALGIEKAHFVAHSFGGVVALGLACMDPGRVIDFVLADTQVSATRHMPRTKEWAVQKTFQRLLNENHIDLKVDDPFFGFHLLDVLARLDAQKKVLSPELEALLGPVRKNAKRTEKQWVELLSTTSAEAGFMTDDGLTEERLRELKFPILAMYGEHSNGLHCGQWLQQLWEHSSFVTVRDAGHFFPTSQPLVFIEACRRFWRDNAAIGDVRAPMVRSERVPSSDRSQIGGTG